MSSPDSVNEMAHWLQDNLSKYLWNVDRSELEEFVEKLMPNISPHGVQEIYPMVSETFPPRSTPTYGDDRVQDDDLPINYGGTK